MLLKLTSMTWLEELSSKTPAAYLLQVHVISTVVNAVQLEMQLVACFIVLARTVVYASHASFAASRKHYGAVLRVTRCMTWRTTYCIEQSFGTHVPTNLDSWSEPPFGGHIACGHVVPFVSCFRHLRKTPCQMYPLCQCVSTGSTLCQHMSALLVVHADSEEVIKKSKRLSML